MKEQNPATVRGIVIASGWGKDGRVSAVDIADFDEKRYRVINDETGKQLHALVKQQVTAEGWLTRRDNTMHIQVLGFQIETPVFNGL